MGDWKARVNVKGLSPLLMHADSIDWRDRVDKWLTVPDNKKKSKAGDDRTPAWKWLGGVYHDGVRICMPSDNIMTMLREGGKKVPVPGGRGNQSFKGITQSGLMCTDFMWPFLNGDGAEVPWAPFEALMEEEDYEVHKQTALDNGFYLFAKPAKVGTSKHIRVRPRFDKWSFSFDLDVRDDQITLEVLQTILDVSGARCGLCDWRPSSPQSPGPFGMFESEVTKIG